MYLPLTCNWEIISNDQKKSSQVEKTAAASLSFMGSNKSQAAASLVQRQSGKLATVMLS